uniref:Dimer_Tnp_hAT domain-containing protein n=1 Tax=Panagrellus redivivus TaxID=6233 RepID=A0A7E4VCX8_PANRE
MTASGLSVFGSGASCGDTSGFCISDCRGASEAVEMPKMSRAPIYAHFTESETHFFCKYCPCKYIKDKSKSTGNLHKHFNRHRRETSEFSDADLLSMSLSLMPPVKREKSEPIAPFLTPTISANHEQTPTSVPCSSVSQMPEQTEAIVRFFTAYDIPFKLVESDEFRHMFNVGTFRPKLPSCDELVDNYLPKVANATRDQLKKTLNGLSVALGFDQFKVEEQECISVTVSYVRNWRIIRKRLDVYKLNGDNGDTGLMKQRIEEKLEEYGIDSVIGAVHRVTKEINNVCNVAGREHFPGFDNLLDLAVGDGFDDVVRSEMRLAERSIEESELNSLLPEEPYGTSSTGGDYVKPFSWYLYIAKLDSYLRILPLLTIPEDCPNKPDVAFLQNLSEMLHFVEQLYSMTKGRDAYASLIPYLYLRLTNYCNKPNLDPKLRNFANSITKEASHNYSENYEDNKAIHMCCLFDPRFAFNSLILPNAVWDNLKEELISLYPDTVADMTELPSTSDDWAPLSRSNVKSKIEVELDLYKSDKRLPMPTPDKNNNQDVLEYWERFENELPLLAKEVHKHLPLLCSSTEREYAYRDLETLISPTTQSTKPETVRDIMTIRLEATKRRMNKNLNSKTPLVFSGTHEVTVNVSV